MSTVNICFLGDIRNNTSIVRLKESALSRAMLMSDYCDQFLYHRHSTNGERALSFTHIRP